VKLIFNFELSTKQNNQRTKSKKRPIIMVKIEEKGPATVENEIKL